MSADGMHESHGTHDRVVPRPAKPPQVPAVPPPPAHAPGTSDPLAAGERFLAWLRAPRPTAAAGIWRWGHVPRPEQAPEQVPGRQLVSGALIAGLCAWLLWSLMWNGYLGTWWLVPLELFTPDSLRFSGDQTTTLLVYYGYYALIAAGLLFGAARAGRWAEVWRRYVAPRLKRPESPVPPAGPPGEDVADWPQLRAAGAVEAADRLAAEARSGRMSDVDYARITRAWQGVRRGTVPLPEFTRTVMADGAAACAHPSGVRDLPHRRARHDLLTSQVRVGTAVDDERNPWRYRSAGIALAPDLLGTSVLAVGPANSGKTRTLLAPVAESLCLHALAGRAAVVAVGTAGAPLGADDDYDVVIRLGHPDSAYDLDLYGGTSDPDEAATLLAEALVGDLADPQPGADSRRSATVLAQLLGPFHTVHDRFPSVPELRELLEGTPKAISGLRLALDEAGQESMLRELDARERQMGSPGDPGRTLADRLALLDRPAFAAFFNTTGQSRSFALNALDHPMRVRIDLPGRSHVDASHILTRLVLAQFTLSAAHRSDRSLFACLVLDDASRTVTAESVRGLQQLRSANAGVLLALRTMDDVPGQLRTSLLGAVGCRIALAGLTPWDGQQFAETWGKEWRDQRDVTDRQIIAEGAAAKTLQILRRAITGRERMQQAVTVRQVERERWSASDLAHAVPAGHGVLSLASVGGESMPPLLVDLRR